MATKWASPDPYKTVIGCVSADDGGRPVELEVFTTDLGSPWRNMLEAAPQLAEALADLLRMADTIGGLSRELRNRARAALKLAKGRKAP